jgi:hypothetical protein
MKLPAEVDDILKQIEPDYPGLVKRIRVMWSDSADCQKFFAELLTYQDSFDRDGFTLEAYRQLQKVKDAYDAALFEFKTWNLPASERERLAKGDPWSEAYAPYEPPKRRKKPWEQS